MNKLIDISYFIKNSNFQVEKELYLNKNYPRKKSSNIIFQEDSESPLISPFPKILFTPPQSKSSVINYNDPNNLCIKRKLLENSLQKSRNIDNKNNIQNKSYTSNEVKDNAKNKIFFPILKNMSIKNIIIKDSLDNNNSLSKLNLNNNNDYTKMEINIEKNEDIIAKYMNILSIKHIKPKIKNISKINIKLQEKKREEKINELNSKIKIGKIFNINNIINKFSSKKKFLFQLQENKSLKFNNNIFNVSKSVKSLNDKITINKEKPEIKIKFPLINKEPKTPRKYNKISLEKVEGKLKKEENIQTDISTINDNVNNKNKNNIINSLLVNKYSKHKKINQEIGENIINKSYSLQNQLLPKKLLKEYKKESFELINKIKIQKKIENQKLTKMIKLDKFVKPFQSKESINIKFLSNNECPYILYTTTNLNTSIEKYYYTVNKMYIRQLPQYMKHRINWELIDTKIINIEEENIDINFQWKYFADRLNFKKYKYDPNIKIISNKKYCMINLFERNYEIGNKRNMFKNLITYCDKVNLNVFDFVPFTMVVNYSKDIDYFLQSLKEIMNFINNKKNKDDQNLITNRKYSEHFWFDKNYNFLQNQYINISKNFLSDKNYWIIKPPDLYQGKCIQISDDFDEINKTIKNMFKGVNKRLESDTNSDDDESNDENKKKKVYSKITCFNEVIVQKYLDNPLLYKKRKFDIRCYVLVDSNLNVFFCREGHLKGSSEFYNIYTTNKFIHITNHSLQKKSSKFEQYEYGNEMSYEDFKSFMKEENIPLENFNKMIEDMKILVKISFKSVGKKLLRVSPVLCFEIFGYDFILDNDFKPWILEINNNPGLGISSPVIEKLVPRMFDDALRLTIDKIFNTKYSEECIDINGNYKSKYKLEGFKDDDNVFEFLCNVND